MEKIGVILDIIIYNCLIYGFCREGRMKEVLKIFNEMKGVSFNFVIYIILIDGYCRVNDLDEGLRLRQVMEVKGFYSGVVIYNSIFCKLCEEGRIRDVNKFLNEMNEKKVEFDNIICNILINVYCKIGDM